MGLKSSFQAVLPGVLAKWTAIWTFLDMIINMYLTATSQLKGFQG